ncbi:MAG: glycosyltransferase family 2 protein [Spirochaetia bacterium]
MIDPKISIIIPCYNCIRTLPATVNSILPQAARGNHEIILVDDGSKDGTRDYLEKLRRSSPAISVALHETNRGGGAARNTGIALAQGEFVLCFDADDLLGNDALVRLLRKVQDSNLDGATFAGSYSFKRFPGKGRFQDFTQSGDLISIANVFDGTNWPVGANFLYRRDVHRLVGGYPEHHSFDTQGFGIRFLAHGLKAASAPGAFFFQRQFGPQTSYFERAYVSGEYSVGFFLILEELYGMLGPDARVAYLGFPIFSGSSFEHNLMGALKARYAENPGGFFRTATIEKAAARPDGQDAWTRLLDGMHGGDWASAAHDVITSLGHGVHCEVGGFMMQRILAAADGMGASLAAVRKYREKTSVRPHGTNTLRESYFHKAHARLRRLLRQK